MRPGDFSSHIKRRTYRPPFPPILSIRPSYFRSSGWQATHMPAATPRTSAMIQKISSAVVTIFILLSVDVFNPVDNPLVGIQLSSPECVSGIAAEDDFSFVVVDVDDSDFFHSVQLLSVGLIGFRSCSSVPDFYRQTLGSARVQTLASSHFLIFELSFLIRIFALPVRLSLSVQLNSCRNSSNSALFISKQ